MLETKPSTPYGANEAANGLGNVEVRAVSSGLEEDDRGWEGERAPKGESGARPLDKDDGQRGRKRAEWEGRTGRRGEEGREQVAPAGPEVDKKMA